MLLSFLIPICADAESAEHRPKAASGCPNCPSCEDRKISKETIEAAAARALVGLRDPWGADFGAAMARAEAELGCSFHIFDKEDPAVAQRSEELIAIAEDSTTPPSRLQELSRNPDRLVKGAVARNPNTPVSILRELAEEADDAVMYGLASNPNTPPEILRQLLKWRDPYGFTCLNNLATNRGAPVDVLRAISEGEEQSAKFNLLDNPNTPIDILEHLTRSSDTAMSFRAQQALQRRQRP